MRRSSDRRRAVMVLAGALSLTAAAPAAAAINDTRDASTVAGAIVKDPASLRSASWVGELPGTAPDTPAATLTSPPLAGFPLDGGAAAALLTTGDPQLADDPNDSESSGAVLGGDTPVGRGDTAYDVSVLRLDLTAPANANCLTFYFRFASDEYPEFVGTAYNDAFIAELGETTWTTAGSVITAPRNFAFDPAGNVISINATGGESVAAQDAAGTTYDAATQILIASTPTSPGDVTLFLSIFDQGDQVWDAAAFVDDLTFSQAPPGGCQPGAVVNEFDPPVTTPSQPLAPYTRNGQLEFVVGDGPRGSGARALHYKLNGGAEQVQPTVQNKATLTLQDGAYAIEYWGEDRRGNIEANHHNAAVTVDRAAPAVILASNLNRTRYLEGERGTVRIAAADPLSGLAEDPTKKAARLDTNSPGAKILQARATDRAGNVASAGFAYTVRRVKPASLVAAPKKRRCAGRSLRVKVKKRGAIRMRSVTVNGGGKAKTVKGKRTRRPVRVRTRAANGRVKLTVRMLTTSGKRFVFSRRYRAC